MHGVVWNGSIFVAIGEKSILTSPDGWNWTERYSGESGFEGVTWGDGQFVAVGDAGTLYTSVDGFN